MRKRRETETFSLSFLDVICCGFGAVILLLVITKIYEPITIEQSKVELEGLIQKLQEELFDIRGDSTILNRDIDELEQSLSENKELVARLQGELTKIQGQYDVSSNTSVSDDVEQGELLAARQSLTEEMQRLMKDQRRSSADRMVGGIPVDSEYIIFVIDTSGSMFQGPWNLVLQKINETLSVYPRVKGIQVLNDEGRYMFSTFAGRWIPDSPSSRRNILSTLRNWNPYSDSSPVEGITEAINTFYQPGRSVSIYVFGDDFPRGSVEAVVRYVDRVNRSDRFGNRLMRVHAVGFPTPFGRGTSANALRVANLLQVLCERNGGTFVALTSL
ncbi:MAG: VWA domain-containing protein [Gammaproteobacteria bacterium]